MERANSPETFIGKINKPYKLKSVHPPVSVMSFYA